MITAPTGEPLARLVVFAIGNRSRGDDAVGPLLLERFQQRWPQVCAFEVFQLQPEHALDLCEADMVLFIDAAFGLDTAWHFNEISAAAPASPLSHAMSPEAVLDVFSRVQGCAAPPAFTLALQCCQTGLGLPLSDSSQSALLGAWECVVELMDDLSTHAWRSLADISAKRCQGKKCEDRR